MVEPAGIDQLAEVAGGRPVSASDIRYLAGIRDDLIREVGTTFVAEMEYQSSAGRAPIDTLALDPDGTARATICGGGSRSRPAPDQGPGSTTHGSGASHSTCATISTRRSP